MVGYLDKVIGRPKEQEVELEQYLAHLYHSMPRWMRDLFRLGGAAFVIDEQDHFAVMFFSDEISKKEKSRTIRYIEGFLEDNPSSLFVVNIVH